MQQDQLDRAAMDDFTRQYDDLTSEIDGSDDEQYDGSGSDTDAPFEYEEEESVNSYQFDSQLSSSPPLTPSRTLAI